MIAAAELALAETVPGLEADSVTETTDEALWVGDAVLELPLADGDGDAVGDGVGVGVGDGVGVGLGGIGVGVIVLDGDPEGDPVALTVELGVPDVVAELVGLVLVEGLPVILGGRVPLGVGATVPLVDGEGRPAATCLPSYATGEIPGDGPA